MSDPELGNGKLKLKRPHAGPLRAMHVMAEKSSARSGPKGALTDQAQRKDALRNLHLNCQFELNVSGNPEVVGSLIPCVHNLLLH